jgi:uncharacterized protein
VLLDTGPLVAMIRSADSDHERCVEILLHIERPLLTSWPVITEAGWLLRNSPAALSSLYTAYSSGLLDLLALSPGEFADLEELRSRYASLSPQLADLTLVHLAQREGLDTIFTLDRRDFSVYRRKGKSGFHLLPNVK